MWSQSVFSIDVYYTVIYRLGCMYIFDEMQKMKHISILYPYTEDNEASVNSYKHVNKATCHL